eukprot:1122909-Ditylum_brightwellii.AAC.1
MTVKGINDSTISLGNDAGEDFMSWPSIEGNSDHRQAVVRMKRRGSLCDVVTDETPTERFVGKVDEEGEGSGVGM